MADFGHSRVKDLPRRRIVGFDNARGEGGKIHGPGVVAEADDPLDPAQILQHRLQQGGHGGKAVLGPHRQRQQRPSQHRAAAFVAHQETAPADLAQIAAPLNSKHRPRADGGKDAVLRAQGAARRRHRVVDDLHPGKGQQPGQPFARRRHRAPGKAQRGDQVAGIGAGAVERLRRGGQDAERRAFDIGVDVGGTALALAEDQPVAIRQRGAAAGAAAVDAQKERHPQSPFGNGSSPVRRCRTTRATRA